MEQCTRKNEISSFGRQPMNSTLLRSYPEMPEVIPDIAAQVVGYYNNDIWELQNTFFKDAFKGTLNPEHRKVQFVRNNIHRNIILEYKFMLLTRINANNMALSTASNYGKTFCQLSDFINDCHPTLTSIAKLDINIEFESYRDYLNKKGNLLNETRLSHFKQFHEFISDYYDQRPETQKDIWDTRRISGARICHSTASFVVSFVKVPIQFREMIKRFIRIRIYQISALGCKKDVFALECFLCYISLHFPEWTEITLLDRKIMEDFLLDFHSNSKASISTRNYYLILIKNFIDYIQRAEWDEAPILHVSRIILRDDVPPWIGEKRENQEKMKYIPQSVLAQLDVHMPKLPEKYLTIAIILRASGWRISDVLNLRYDKCVCKTEQGFYLCGDITKVGVLDHKVPITDEVAAIILTHARITKEKSTQINNPLKFMFTKFCGRRVGLPYVSLYFSRALNTMARNNNIVDDNGDIYYFVSHAFRHTKGVELINNGMPLIYVQKWLAHVSMEMTLIYAKVLDTTMRKSWEEATSGGLFRFDHTGAMKAVEVSQMEQNDLVEWEYIRHNLDAVRMPLGFCMKPKKQECKSQLNPCLTCVNLCTTPDFIPQFQDEINEIEIIIDKGSQLGRSVWVEKNQILLTKYIEIIGILQEGKTRHLMGKSGREYNVEERFENDKQNIGS